MATLILSTVGTVLGGPIGGAIGSLIGQSIDQQLLGPHSRGPRLGDLSVQTSSYGTQIPRIYGTMRVAGSVIWATDLIQSSQTTGAKGQPDTTYSYSVSFAVALSSRSTTAIGRIWADGKLLRGEDGDFKVSTDFRFYAGDENQAIDPLIGSIEGTGTTPAYRGLSLAVFENLELADYGNRIPFLTFELIADEGPADLAQLFADASDGIVEPEVDLAIDGYAALGSSISAAIAPLVDFYSVGLVDDGERLRSPTSGLAFTIDESDFGNDADKRGIPRLEREQAPARSLPATITLSYYDPERDYQTGQTRATASTQIGIEERDDLPAVLTAPDARALVEDLMAKRWAKRDKLVLRLPPKFIDLEPGAVLSLPLSPTDWTVEQVMIEAMVAVVELRPEWRTLASLPADSGRSARQVDEVAGPVTLALIDIPSLGVDNPSEPAIFLAASGPSAQSQNLPVDLNASGWSSGARTATRKAILGHSTNALGAGQPYLIDMTSSVDVQLVDPDQWLSNCDDDTLVQGGNLAVVGNELIQFGSAQPIGPGQFRLNRLARGRLGTEWAMALHAPGDQFVLIERDALQPIFLPAWTKGSVLTVTQRGISGGVTAIASATVSGESVRPFTPVNLRAAVDGTGNLHISWTRRSRRGLAWIDDVDAPLGEQTELYDVVVDGATGSIERQAITNCLTIASAECMTLGPGPATIAVRQIGDWAGSHAAETIITLS